MATLEGTIHTLWAAKTTLNGLLDSARLITGIVRSQDPPYCTLARVGSVPFHRSSRRTRIDTTLLRFMLYHPSHANGAAIRDAILAEAETSNQGGFDGERFAIASNGGVAVMKKENDFATQDPDTGIWVFTIDFDVTRQLA